MGITRKGGTMSSSTLLLVLLAFAFGLWLGFDPEAHAATEEAWQAFKTEVREFANQNQTSSDETSDEPLIPITGEDPAPSEGSESNEILDQISVFLNELWESVKTLWRDLMQRATSETAE
jgi:hypothetical protein